MIAQQPLYAENSIKTSKYHTAFFALVMDFLDENIEDC